MDDPYSFAMTMYVLCSECGWKPSEFLDLTPRQLKALMEGRERWIEIQNEANDPDSKGTPPKSRRKKVGRGYKNEVGNIRYDREKGTHSIQGGGVVSQAKQSSNKEGKVAPQDMAGVLDGLAQSGSMDSKIWRGGVKKKDRPKTKNEKLKKLRALIAHNDEHFRVE